MDELIEPIYIIFNKSLREGCILEVWRCADVTPIYKKGTRENPLNYRPVSMTCILCKVMEKILKNRVMLDLDSNDILIDQQHGFRAGRSTTSNLIEFYEDVTKELDNKHSVDILYFDLAKAFDTVPHSILIKKLRNLKLSEKIVNWIENYLKSRKQRVVIRGEASEWFEVFSGVPQGSVIGAILFVIFINDIKEGIKSRISIFADDTKIMHIVDTDQDKLEVESDLVRLQKWSE